MHDAFMTLFLIGVFGLVAQTVLGRFHIGHNTHHTAHISHGAHAAHSGHAAHAPSHGVKTASGNHTSSSSLRSSIGSWLIGLASPMLIFSVCLGMGAGGLILLQYEKTPWLLSALAAAIGLGFYVFAVEPLSRLIFAFESKPATALEGTLASEAEVVSSFNAKGDGVVLLSIDGQSSRVLAHLDPSSALTPSEIRVGDKLVVTEIDGQTNSCKVAKL